MHNLVLFRESYKLTIRGLSHMTGISARKLSRVEEGKATLTATERAKLALVFGVSEDTFYTEPPVDPRKGPATKVLLEAFRRRSLLLIAAALLLSVTMLHPQFLAITRATAREEQIDGGQEYLAAAEARPRVVVTRLPLAAFVPSGAQTGRGGTALREEWTVFPTVPPAVLLQPTATPTPTPTPTATPTPDPAVWLSAQGPQGCPLQPQGGRVVMTQGYGVGTHAPAEEWGAVDLALALPAQTVGVPVVATHGGVVIVKLDSWPGGDQVTVSDYASGWRTNYAHLSEVLVVQGQSVNAGDVIGLAGNTGMSSGAHLDYQVWYGGTNIDPTELVQACFVQ